MGEALLIKTGGAGSGDSSENNKNLITEIFTSNTLWKVPEGIRNNQVSVRIFGGGGGGTGYIGGGGTAGGGGCMNNAILNLYNESEVFITIGRGGYYHKDLGIMNSGTTSFGIYLSALGEYGSGASGTPGRQFGGGGIALNARTSSAGGSGGKWGGGGGFAGTNGNSIISRGGCLHENSQSIYETTGYSGLAGNGGGFINKYTSDLTQPEDGVNTIGLGLDFEGAGKNGGSISSKTNMPYTTPYLYTCGGGGGYGGNGGKPYLAYNDSKGWSGGSGGGGGYGANGGNGSSYAGGGGGGYGGDGGDAYYVYSGGGGGYGKKGKGGYFDPNINDFVPPGIAAGSADMNHAGGSGICIIQYYLE